MVHELKKGDEPANLAGITKMRVGLAWDTSTGMSGGIIGRIKERFGSDLDLIVIGANENNKAVRYVGLDNLDPMNGAVVHSGDNTTGRGDGDDESVDIDLTKIPAPIHFLHIVAAAMKVGSSFKRAKNVDFNVYDGSDGEYSLVAQAMPELTSNKNIHQVLKLFRSGTTWKMDVPDAAGTIQQGDPEALMRFALR